MGQSITLAAGAAAAAPKAIAAPAVQQVAPAAPAFNPEQAHLAIIEQSDKALNAISSANSVMSTALTALGIMLPFAVALAVFLFNRAVKEAAQAAAAEARTLLNTQAREAIASVKGDTAAELKKAVDEARLISAAEIELMSSNHEKKLNAIHADARAQAELNAQQFMEAQASYRAQLDVEYNALKGEMRTRLDQIAEEQISRLEDLVKKLPESNEAQIQLYFSELRAADEENRKQLQARLDAMVKAQRVGVPTVTHTPTGSILFHLTQPDPGDLPHSIVEGVNSLASDMAKVYGTISRPVPQHSESPLKNALISQGIITPDGKATGKPIGAHGEGDR